MKIIGQGAQYKVIDTLDGRVKKILLTPNESRAVITGWYKPAAAPVAELSIDYQKIAKSSCKGIQELLALNPSLAPHFANPLFEQSANYTQDKVVLLGDALSKATTHEGQKLLDAYIAQIQLHWQYGFSEIVFNPMTNNGLDASGNVVLIDLGELSFSKDEVKQRVAERAWQKSWAYTKGLPQPLRQHYGKIITDLLTKSNLDDLWPTN